MKVLQENKYDNNQLVVPYVIKILIYHHKIEYTFYFKAMKMLINLCLRNQKHVLPVSMIRHSLSSMKLDRNIVKCMLRDMQTFGFLTYVPRQGYRVNKLVDVLDKIPYSSTSSK